MVATAVAVLALLLATGTVPAEASPPIQVASIQPGLSGVPAFRPDPERDYFASLGEQMKELLYRELSDSDRKGLRGSVASIEVRYSAAGSFEMARVRAADNNILAATLHRKIVWKSLPPEVKQTAAHMEVKVKENGLITIRHESH